MRQARKQNCKIKVFTIFMTDIEKALYLKLNINLLILLLEHYYHKLKLFQFSEIEKLLLFQRPDIIYRIKFKQIDSKDSKAL